MSDSNPNAPSSSSASSSPNIPSSSSSSSTPRIPDMQHSTRPNTASTDPFASPVSSRPPSISSASPSASFSASPSLSANANAVAGGTPPPGLVPRRPILAQTGFGTPYFPSARSSMARLSSTANLHHGASSLSASATGVSATNGNSNTPKPKIARMKSHMLPPSASVPKPWLDAAKRSPRALISYYIVWAIIALGLAGGAAQCFFTWRNVKLDTRPLCLVMQEDFEGGEDKVFGPGGTFMREVNMDGFGTGEFEMTTSSRNNSFISNGQLYIVPTLTSDNIGNDAVFDGTVYNITDCTFNVTRPDSGYIMKAGQRVFDIDSYTKSCSAVSNRTAGTVINPVQSARLTTLKSASIRYGRVEIRAKMPNGDWMWPAMWMLPKDSVYGAWPRSGEIDIVESRGNGLKYTARGSNYVQGALNWGPSPSLNGVSKSYSWWTEKRKSFGSGFHTYALEWTPEFLRIYVDTRLHTLLDMRFDRPFFQRGEFPETVFNGSSLVALQNPWLNGTNATPFDQDFYLILNVAVGSTTGWFPEGQGDKPWLDRAQSPPRDFARGIAQWYPTWPRNVEDRAMVVDYVKMWKHCDA